MQIRKNYTRIIDYSMVETLIDSTNNGIKGFLPRILLLSSQQINDFSHHQPISFNLTEKVILPNGEIENRPTGKTIEYQLTFLTHRISN